MKQVPIYLDFNRNTVIGYANIDETKIPKDVNWVLAVGAVAERPIEKGKTDSLKRGIHTTTYEIDCLSLQSDEAYAEYLRSSHYF